MALTYKPRAVLLYECDIDTGRNNIPTQKIISQLQEIIVRIHAELHLNGKVYDIWSAAIKEELIKYEAQYEHGTH